MVDRKVDLIVASQSDLGEGALWYTETRRLYWVDINPGLLYIYNPENGENQRFEIGEMIGTVVPIEAGGLLLALENSVVAFDPENGALGHRTEIRMDDEERRFNDGKCDPAGRFWVGSISAKGSAAAKLYRIDGDYSVHTMVTGVRTSNGIVWSADRKTMYYIDTPTHEVVAYDYDHDSGEIANPRTVITVPDGLGGPDGMSIDAEDRLWIAMFRGASVTCWDPQNGELLETIPIPAPNVTSCAFGGPDLRDLYITTARVNMTEADLEVYPAAGGLFRVRLDAAGVPANTFVRR